MIRDRSALVMLLVSILMLFLIGASAIMNLRMPFWCFLAVWLVVCALLLNRR